MKKLLNYFIILLILIVSLLISTDVYHAYETKLSVGVSASTIKIGDSVTVTVKAPGAVSGPVSLYFPTDIMEYVSASTEANVVGGTIQFSIGKGGRAASDTVTVKLKAKTTGTANLKVEATGDIYDYDSLEEVVLDGASTSVAVENKTVDTGNNTGGSTSEPQKSDDNSLSSLKLSSGTLSPKFKYNVVKYTATVEHDVSKVVVSAKTSNAKATIESVTGDGTVNLAVGKNTIKIVVRSESGVKATYTIVVTRKAQETPVAPPTDSETKPVEPEFNEFLKYNEEQLVLIEDIPKEYIPSDFENKLLVVNGEQMQGLSFVKGDLNALCLNNTNDVASLYVYDGVQQVIYPFVKFLSEDGYIIVLLPDEQTVEIPNGYESCNLPIEGKGIINAYKIKDDAANMEDGSDSSEQQMENDFYLIYCMNNNGEQGWYLYDVVERTFMRYAVVENNLQIDDGVEEKPEQNDTPDTEQMPVQNEYLEIEQKLNETKNALQFAMCAIAAFIVVTIVLLILLIVRSRGKEEQTDVNEQDELENLADIID